MEFFHFMLGFLRAGLLGFHCTKNNYRNKDTDNSRNGYSRKTVHSSFGDMDLEVPRDRKGEFEPQLIQKHQNTLTQDIEAKIISMYAKGMSTGDIENHIKDLYGIEIVFGKYESKQSGT